MQRSRKRTRFTLGVSILIWLVAAACSSGDAPAEQAISATPAIELPERTPLPTPSAVSPSGILGSDEVPASQSPLNLRFERISTEDGLSLSSVSSILQDTQGYMWFGTRDGLNKYDGYSFTVYRHDPEDPSSLQSSDIGSIYEDRSGVLWFGTRDGWLERFDREHVQFTHNRLGSGVRSIYEDTAGVFWIGTDDPGLMRFDRGTGEAALVWPGKQFASIFEDREGVVWAGNLEGALGRYDRERDRFVPYDVDYPVVAIYEDQAGELWIGTIGGGLAQFDRDTQEFIHYRHDPSDPNSLGSDLVPSIDQHRSGALWIAAYGGGLDHFHPNTGRFTHYQHNPADPYSLSNDFVLSVYQDRSGVLWVGTEFGGLNKLPVTGTNVSHFRNIPNDPNSLGNNTVTAFFQDRQGVLWVGTRGGLDRFDRASGQWRHYRHDPDEPSSLRYDYVGSIYEDQAGLLWIGTGGGLDRYDREDDQFVHYPVPETYGMHQDRSGNLWVASSDGLYRFDRDADRFALLRGNLIGEESYWGMQILEDSRGLLWIGISEEGLGRYDPRTDEWRLYQHDPDDPHSLNHNRVESILEGQSGMLWVGTHAGLNRFDPATETFTHYRVKDGLPNDTVLGILEDKAGNLWLSTNQGLSRFDLRTETFRNYDVGDGLQGNQFRRGAFHKSPSGEMFFGGENGFNAFYPEQITDNPVPPPVVITALNLFNEVVRIDLPPDENIELGYQDNFLSFDFAALDFNNPEKNQYAYQMEAVDEDWVYAGNRTHADYPNLSPGKYVFRVKGSNNDGIWNEEGTAVHITIKPPFWGTAWFRGLVLLAVVGASVGGYRLRVRSVEARSRELERQVEQEINERMKVEEALRQSEMEKAVTEERGRLARELHDAVTQTLFSASLIAEVLPRIWEVNQERGRQQLDEVRLLTRGALAEMRTLLLELRPEAIVKAKMEDLLRQLARAMMGRTGVPVDVTIEGECKLPSEVQIALYRIAQEALNNAAKHADAGQVEVGLCCTAAVVMEDEGRRTEDQGPTTDDRRRSSAFALDAAQTTDGGGVRIELRVSDDGRGFDPREVPPGHLGLAIMRERAEAIGAALEVESSLGRGTRVTVVWSEDEGRRTDDEG